MLADVENIYVEVLCEISLIFRHEVGFWRNVLEDLRIHHLIRVQGGVLVTLSYQVVHHVVEVVRAGGLGVEKLLPKRLARA